MVILISHSLKTCQLIVVVLGDLSHITLAVSCVLHDCNERSVSLLWQTGACTGVFLNIKIKLLWVITPYRLINNYRRIEGS